MATDIRVCVTCDSRLKLNMKYDSKYCETCDKWVEKACKDPSCEFCSYRPSKPSEVKDRKQDICY